MVSSHWPLADLWLQTPELVLRWPSPDDLHALADLAAAGVHDPEVQPFMVAWTDASPGERARSTLQYHWSCWGSWKPSLVRLRPAGQVLHVLGVDQLTFQPGRLQHIKPDPPVG